MVPHEKRSGLIRFCDELCKGSLPSAPKSSGSRTQDTVCTPQHGVARGSEPNTIPGPPAIHDNKTLTDRPKPQRPGATGYIGTSVKYITANPSRQPPPRSAMFKALPTSLLIFTVFSAFSSTQAYSLPATLGIVARTGTVNQRPGGDFGVLYQGNQAFRQEDPALLKDLALNGQRMTEQLFRRPATERFYPF